MPSDPSTPPAQPAHQRSFRRAARLLICLLIALKLILISHDETQAAAWDPFQYAYGASTLHWGTPYGTWAYDRQPIYSLFLAGAEVFGLPSRLWIELAWIGATLLMLAALRTLGVRTLLALTAFTAALFHPWTFTLFNITLSDTLYGTLVLVFLSTLAVVITRDSRADLRRWGALAAAAAALAANTRVESVLITGSLLVAAVCIASLHVALKVPARLTLQRILWAVIFPLAATLALTQAIRQSNRHYVGLAMTNDLTEMPGFNQLYKALLSIRPQKPDLRLSIPRDVRTWAYDHSPTFARLQPHLESDPIMSSFSQYSRAQTGVEGEYGAWTVWAIRAAAWQMQPWPNARELNDFYAAAAEELQAALSHDPEVSRWTPVTFIPPEWGLLIRAVPTSLAHCWTALSSADFQRLPDATLPPGGLPRLNAIANRRIPLVDIANGSSENPSAWLRPKVIARLDSCKRFLAKLVHPLTIASLAVIALGTLVAILRRRAIPKQWWIVSVIILPYAVARFALFALMDATGYAAEMRFMFPIAVPLVVLAIINADTLLTLAAARRRAARS